MRLLLLPLMTAMTTRCYCMVDAAVAYAAVAYAFFCICCCCICCVCLCCCCICCVRILCCCYIARTAAECGFTGLDFGASDGIYRALYSDRMHLYLQGILKSILTWTISLVEGTAQPGKLAGKHALAAFDRRFQGVNTRCAGGICVAHTGIVCRAGYTRSCVLCLYRTRIAHPHA